MGPSRILGLASQSVRPITFCTCHDTTACWCAVSVHLHLKAMSISIKQDLLCARAVWPFSPPEKKKGVQHMLFHFLENCFSRAAWNLFDVGNQSVPTHLVSNPPRVCSVRYVPKHTAGITGTGHFGKFGTSIPAPDTSVRSVRHQ